MMGEGNDMKKYGLKKPINLNKLELVKFEPSVKFDRENPQSVVHLSRLRAKGFSRLENTDGVSGKDVCDTLRRILPAIFFNEKRGVYIDCGCGEAPETFFMASNGFKSFGLDVFPLDPKYTKYEGMEAEFKTAIDVYKETRNASFVLQDVCEKWDESIPNGDVITAHAMITLMKEPDIKLFFQNVFTHSNKNCLFSISAYPLTSGYFDTWEIRNGSLREILEKTAKNTGWKILETTASTMLLTK